MPLTAEAAYCAGRIARSTALAQASTDICARASHVGIAGAYRERLSALEAVIAAMQADAARDRLADVSDLAAQIARPGAVGAERLAIDPTDVIDHLARRARHFGRYS